ncbi:hypothetical protein ACOJUR_10535 [Alicyclobacillus tolerans]|uniref:Uncharacterized protein n=2 Tax=Alicyclobacillus tolerans TaxID=90970 RepID=A0A1M6XJ44_9BACL|nr:MULTISPECIES: hypothetical protein [Alicyclobacillus]MDP9728787.1 membrane protein implicated in regulation of membrane protease activity [Alicyclobacillus tengchongensis]QRF23206.1 hypothetical protein FY534_05615 [Alicyclobacillus sp. TC]SHL06014.1 hypothetical protein SAMN05443507_13425 [Alicyclobacillus montanus]
MPFFYYLVWGLIAILAIGVLSIFLAFFIKIAILLALIAFAYYWFSKAVYYRKQRKNWRH